MASRFRTIRKFLAPWWLTTGEAELIGYSLDLMKDAFLERLRQGLLARFPSFAPDDALPVLSRQRRVLRGLSESKQSWIARMLLWLDDRKVQGNPLALMQKLAEYAGPLPKFRTVDARGNWFTRNVDGTFEWLLKQANFEWDDHPGIEGDEVTPLRWSRFWVIIYPNGLWTAAPNWGDVGETWGDTGKSWGTTATPDVVQTVRAIVSEWKPLHAHCVNIIIAFDPASFDPTAAVDDAGMPNGLWEHWSRVVGGVQVPARLATARYWDGV